MTFAAITDRSEVGRLVSLSLRPETSERWLEHLLDRGESRLEWCRGAWDGNVLLAAHVFDSWSPLGEPESSPAYLHLLGHRDDGAATDLLLHDVAALAAGPVEAHVVVPADASAELRALRDAQRAVLAAAGFSVDVERVRLEWPGAAVAPQPRRGLTFRAAATLPNDLLQPIFAAVGDGSADHRMQQDRADVGREQEAADRLQRAQHRDFPDEWFVVGFDASGDAVGYVQAARLSEDSTMLAELGVVEAHRGHRYVDELLAYGTGCALGAGLSALVSDTDQANVAMRAAFARGGYIEFATRTDLTWRPGGTHSVRR